MRKILIDAVFFQYNRSGIARVWYSLLSEWVKENFISQILVLDRQNTVPRIPGISYRTIRLHSYEDPAAEKKMLQTVCDEEKADLFISSYYTSPISTPSVFMAYDMIPEFLGWDIARMAIWQEKHAGIRHANAFISISHNTAKDIGKFLPDVAGRPSAVAHCGVDFEAPAQNLVDEFKGRNGINKPYFLLVGSRGSYKNAILFFRAFELLGEERAKYAIVCTGPWASLEAEFQACVGGASIHMLEVDDTKLQCAYAGAIALVYPSIYEGFGMPITEAMACGCPVITCPTGSIPEVAQDGVLYVNTGDTAAMLQALYQVQGPLMRSLLIEKGLERAKQFSWKTMAEQVKDVLLTVDLQREQPVGSVQPVPVQTKENMLSNIIPAEISNDEFYEVLKALAGRQDLKNFLEIGSSSGAGSTHAFVSGLAARADVHNTRLYCMELSKERYVALSKTYESKDFVKVYNQSSVALEEFPSEEEVAFFYANTRTNLNAYPLTQVISWLKQDIDYMRQSGLTLNGMELIKQENAIVDFDMVLIDGSEFTGEAELCHCLGAKIIALDDVNSHKCFNAYRILANHVSYALTHQNMELRNGFAVFERRF